MNSHVKSYASSSATSSKASSEASSHARSQASSFSLRLLCLFGLACAVLTSGTAFWLVDQTARHAWPQVNAFLQVVPQLQSYDLFSTITASLAALASFGMLFFVTAEDSRFLLAITALLAFALHVVLGIIFLHPINLEIQNWTPTRFPPDWIAYGERWGMMETFRFIISLFGLQIWIASTAVTLRHEIKPSPVPERPLEPEYATR